MVKPTFSHCIAEVDRENRPAFLFQYGSCRATGFKVAKCDLKNTEAYWLYTTKRGCMLIIAGIALGWRKWFMKHHEHRMDVETRRRELEKQQWMNEMRMKMATEHAGNQYVAEHEAVKVDLTTEDLVVFTREICEHYVSPDPDKKVKVSFISTVDQLIADFDETKLKEIFEILFRNSISFTPYAPSISVGVARSGNEEAQIQVADNGIGIKDEYKEHAFDPMVNGEGIGLDYVKAIIDAHGGTIRIEDNPGGGTIFFITLPAQAEIEVVEAEVIE